MKEVFGLQFLEETEATEGDLMACAVIGAALPIGYCYAYQVGASCSDDHTVIYDEV
ncbi:MAG: hypothetical protein ACM3XM_01740 [Mycobacterium leprae]